MAACRLDVQMRAVHTRTPVRGALGRYSVFGIRYSGFGDASAPTTVRAERSRAAAKSKPCDSPALRLRRCAATLRVNGEGWESPVGRALPAACCHEPWTGGGHCPLYRLEAACSGPRGRRPASQGSATALAPNSTT